ncbi:MAG: glycosyltransferase family 39 protein [Planctomycetota bacterium]
MAITLLAGVWRFVGLQTPAFDHDEVYEITERTTDLRELAFRHDGFPPIYRWLVAGVMETTGSDMAARWFSLVVGVATIPLVALLGAKLAGSRAGLLAAAFMAVSANHSLISQQARGYVLMVFFASGMLLTAWRLRSSDRWIDWAAFLTCSWLAIATHYFAGLLLLLLGPLLLLEKRGPALRRGLTAAVLLAIAGIPLMICLRADLAETGEFHHEVGFDKEAYAFGYLWLVTGNTLGPSVSELREMVSLGDKAGAIRAIAPWAMLCLIPVGVLLTAAAKRLRSSDLAWLVVLMLAPPLMAAVAATASPTGYNYRYLVWMLVPLTVWLAAGATVNRNTAVAAVWLIGLSVYAGYNHRFVERYHENDFHAVVELIESLDKSAEAPAVLAAPLYYGRGALYSMPSDWTTATVTAHPSGEQDWDAKLPEFAERLGSRDEVWLVAQWFPLGHPQRAVCDELAERLNAELVERVASTTMVYRFPVDATR